MGEGGALAASIEIIKMLYETAETYRKLDRINKTFLNEIALLITLQDQIKNCKRMGNNIIIENYLNDINYKLEKFKKIVDDIDNQNFIKKIIYTKKVEKIGKEIANAVKKLKFLLDIKKDLNMSSKMDIANIINDIEGRQFWENNFGSEHTYVQVNLFFSAIRMNTTLLTSEIDFLKKVINDDGDKYISAFEFQEWLDFFGDFSVVMRRTIDSLFDANTLEIVEWYHKNISKNLVKSLLRDHLFIIRKHTTQKGVFIINFNYNDELCNLYIRNKNNIFQVERVSEMTMNENMIYENIDIKHSPNLREIALRIETLLNPGSSVYVDWEKQRKEMMDQNVVSGSPREESIFDKITHIEIPKFEIPAIMDGVESIWDTIFCKKR